MMLLNLKNKCLFNDLNSLSSTLKIFATTLIKKYNINLADENQGCYRKSTQSLSLYDDYI